MRVESLHLYPVKSAAVLDVSEATVERWGLHGDRRWAVVGKDGSRLSAPRHRTLMRVRAQPTPAGIRLSADGVVPLEVPYPLAGVRVPVGLSELDSAVLADDAAAEWFSSLLGVDARLVWLDDPYRRPVRAVRGGRDGDPLSLADNTPILLTSLASLAQLNAWIAEDADSAGAQPQAPVPINRFRPNIVIDGEDAFEEDRWATVRIGEVEFRFASRCDRCAVTTIDPASNESSHEPLRTLAKHRKWDGHVWFGAALIPVTPGFVRVGDAVEVSSAS